MVVLDVMKFHHLGQLLLDTNCLLLVMKMFGMQDVSMTVVSKADSPDNKYVVTYIIHTTYQCSDIIDKLLSILSSPLLEEYSA